MLRRGVHYQERPRKGVDGVFGVMAGVYLMIVGSTWKLLVTLGIQHQTTRKITLSGSGCAKRYRQPPKYPQLKQQDT